jgi:amidophosphoribosyltransferase
MRKDFLKEKCGVFGIYSHNADAARITYFGLFALQHRGQEASGISASDGKKIRTHKATGLVTHVYEESHLKKLKGFMAIGHNRYSTSGASVSDHVQPVIDNNDILSLAHNGNIPDTDNIKRFLKSKGIFIKGLNDSELIHKAIRYYLVRKFSLEDSVKHVFPLLKGAFCILILTKNKLLALRDKNGIRPLSLGKLNGGYVVSSETCAMDTVDAKFLRDIAPGEMVVVDQNGLKSYELAKPDQKLDIFEFIYFCRPDSILLGQQVYTVRKNLGYLLAKEHPVKADVVIPVPDSAIPAAIGYAEASKIRFDFGLSKNRHIGRTFITPNKRLRDRAVQMKLNPVKEIISGKRVVVVDDSIVRGTTAQRLVEMLFDSGAKEVHMLSSCPPYTFPDFYGIDTPKQKDLIASQMSIQKMKQSLNATSLHFLSFKSLIEATNLPESVFCTSCFTGKYPIDIGKNKKFIKNC